MTAAVPDDTRNRDRREVQAFADRGGTIDDVPLAEQKVPLIEGVEAHYVPMRPR